jgi:WD40 repeat protein
MGGTLWDTATKTKVCDIDFVSKYVFLCDRQQQAAFSADGSRLAVLTHGGIASVLEAGTAEVLHELADHEAPVNGVAFSADDQWLVTASDDGTLRIWRADSGECEGVLEHGAPLHHPVFSPDGRWVAALDKDRTLRIWDVVARRKCARLPLDPEESGPLIFNFSPNGKCVLTASYGRDSAVLWDAQTGQKLAELHASGEGGPIRTMGFSTTGKRVLIGAAAGAALIYDTEVCGSAADLLALAARRVPRLLTGEERERFQIPIRK